MCNSHPRQNASGIITALRDRDMDFIGPSVVIRVFSANEVVTLIEARA